MKFCQSHFSRGLVMMLLVMLAFTGVVRAAESAKKPLLDLTSDLAKVVKSECTELTFATGPQGLEVKLEPGKAGYPGMRLTPTDGPWDLSAFGHIEARITNTGKTYLSVALRVDNAGPWQDNPWNTESVGIKPGATETVTVIFGHAYGHKPSYALNPKAVISLLIFSEKVKEASSYRIESILAAGPAGEKPPVDPKSIRIKPKDGVIVGAGLSLEATNRFETKTEAEGTFIAGKNGGQTLRVTFPERNAETSIAFKPTVGKWDLRDASEVCIKIKNDGKVALTPVAKVLSEPGPTDVITAPSALAPGAEMELVIPFQAAVPWLGQPGSGDKMSWDAGVKNTGTKFISDAVSGIWISAQHQGSASMTIESITATSAPVVLPDWVGKRPPVEGNWVKTFDDEFEGSTIDQTKWNIAGPNFWDKKSHWSKDNLIIGDGLVKMRYEKKTGYQNDDSTKEQTGYASGFLDTYGKWVQRYGYFETRVKLPTSPGLWPAFWLMPDRGVAAGPQWVRQDTGKNGMEFDVMEHLTRWGPHRFNIAMHWDGYGKQHKALGTQCVYVQADKDGFITTGLLWTPGSAIYYCNGKEVLRWEDARISSIESNMMFTLPMGGWDNNGLDDTKLPADFVIDYVRVWQRKDLASEVDGPKSEQAPAITKTEKPKANP